MKLDSVKLARVEAATPRALLVRLDSVPAASVEAYRLPGMTVDLRVAGAPAATLALVSQPSRKVFEVLVERASETGRALEKLAPGADVELTTPAGAGFSPFDFRRHDLYLVGHGLGLGAVRAALLHALTERGAFENIRVLAEARFLDEIPFRDELPGWQRAGVRVYQVMARPDMGKWKRGEGAYVHDLLRELAPSARAAVFASGPEDMLQGVQGALRAVRFPPEKLFLFEHVPAGRERAREAARPPELLAKITPEGIFGSGHQSDAADHAPVLRTPSEQPRGTGLAPYQRAAAAGGGAAPAGGGH